MADDTSPPNDTKTLFRKAGACSQVFGSVVDRRFGNPAIDYERALTRLAGGIVNRGHQCGLLWGSSMGAGLEAGHRCATPEVAVGLALVASGQLHASFEAHAQALTCRDITHRRLDTMRGRAGFVLEAVAVAGFGGGLGLSGNTCGALAAAVWMKGLRWVREHQGKAPGPRTDTGDERTLKIFEAQTGGVYDCRAICGRRFDSVDAHTQYLEDGGCQALIDALAGA